VSSSQSFLIVFDNDANVPGVSVFTDSCRYGGVDVIYTNIDSTMSFIWDFSGTTDTGMVPSFRYPESGLEDVTLTIIDTVCNRDYGFNFLADIIRIDGRVYIPNAFTPNDDSNNEEFRISGNSCLEDPILVIFDSWGNEVFRSENPFQEFWDGTFNGKPVPQDVYTYRFTGGEEVRMGTITIIQ
jgi:gliding motility-associated-like protein